MKLDDLRTDGLRTDGLFLGLEVKLVKLKSFEELCVSSCTIQYVGKCGWPGRNGRFAPRTRLAE